MTTTIPWPTTDELQLLEALRAPYAASPPSPGRFPHPDADRPTAVNVRMAADRPARFPRPEPSPGPVEALLAQIPADADRCDYQPGRLRCIRPHHPDQPNAHVRVSGTAEEASLKDEQ